MTIEDALEFPDPYKALISSNSMRNLAILARNDLIATHPQNVDDIMRLWFIRWWALLKLSFFDIIKLEADKLNVFEHEGSGLFFEQYPQVFPDRTGPMISFELKIFINSIPSLKGNHFESLHLMYQMLYARSLQCYKLNKLQRTRIVFQIINLLLSMEDTISAAAVLNSIASNMEENVDIWSALGRLE